jgi:hypothetical protein
MTTLEEESISKRAWMLALKIAGATCWALAYEEAISEAKRKNGEQLLPRTAINFNLSWEAIYSAGGLTKWKDLTIEDRVQTVINVLWLTQDLRWARTLGAYSKNSRATLLLAVLYQLGFLARLPPGEAARISALWQNLAFSAHAAVKQRAPGPGSHAFKFSLLRAIGTAVPTFTSGVLRGIEPKYLLPGLGCISFDALRIARQLRSRG